MDPENTQAELPASDAMDPATGPADPSPAAADPGEQKPISGFEKRINELTKNWRETERDRDDAKRNADEARRDAQYWRDQALRAQQPQQPAKPAETAVKTLADFEYDDAKYQSYVLEQAEQRAVKAAEKRLKEQQEADTRERRKAEFAKREAAFEKDNPDYRSKTRSPSFAVSDAMAEVFQESEEGPAVALYLANNLGLADTIARLPPLAAARELGRIEAQLVSERKAAKKVSETPPPVPKLEGSGDSTPRPPTTSPESDKLTDDEWVKAEQQRLARKQKRASQ